MSDKFFVDTNILVYAHDQAAGEKHRRAQELVSELWNSAQGVLSTQVLQELCVNLRKHAANPVHVDQVRQIIGDYSAWEVITNTSESILKALDSELRYKTSFWDALVLQAAQAAGASVLYSEDLAHGQNYGTVRVVNPFL